MSHSNCWQYVIDCFFQAGALLQVYLDGTVLVSHGGTEYGQGINTKMIQVGITILVLTILLSV